MTMIFTEKVTNMSFDSNEFSFRVKWNCKISVKYTVKSAFQCSGEDNVHGWSLLSMIKFSQTCFKFLHCNDANEPVATYNTPPPPLQTDNILDCGFDLLTVRSCRSAPSRGGTWAGLHPCHERPSPGDVGGTGWAGQTWPLSGDPDWTAWYRPHHLVHRPI